jgi:hypothetical protein
VNNAKSTLPFALAALFCAHASVQLRHFATVAADPTGPHVSTGRWRNQTGIAWQVSRFLPFFRAFHNAMKSKVSGIMIRK